MNLKIIDEILRSAKNMKQNIDAILRFLGAVPWYSRQLERLNSMPFMGSSLEWTVPP